MKKITLVLAIVGLTLASACAQSPKKDTQTKEVHHYDIGEHKLNQLDDAEYYIMVNGGTEARFSSPLNNEKRAGVYTSPATGDTLFVSSAKFDSGTGWPSFDSATDKVGLGPYEQGGREVIEKSTGYHLGHVFFDEGFTSKNKRYCINGDALEFIPEKQKK